MFSSNSQLKPLSCWIIKLATPISDYQPIRKHHMMFLFKFTNWMTNSVDPDQMASSEAIWFGSTLFAKEGVVVNRSHLIWIYTVSKGRGCREQQDKGASIGGSVGCTSNWRPGGRRFDPHQGRQHFSWRLIMKCFLRSFSLFRWFKKGSCQFLAKECAQYWLTAKRIKPG